MKKTSKQIKYANKRKMLQFCALLNICSMVLLLLFPLPLPLPQSLSLSLCVLSFVIAVA